MHFSFFILFLQFSSFFFLFFFFSFYFFIFFDFSFLFIFSFFSLSKVSSFFFLFFFFSFYFFIFFLIFSFLFIFSFFSLSKVSSFLNFLFFHFFIALFFYYFCFSFCISIHFSSFFFILFIFLFSSLFFFKIFFSFVHFCIFSSFQYFSSFFHVFSFFTLFRKFSLIHFLSVVVLWLCGAGAARQCRTQYGLLTKIKKRMPKVKFYKKYVAITSKIAKAGLAPSGLHGVRCMGMAPTTLKVFRTTIGRCLPGKHAARSLTWRLAVHQCDPIHPCRVEPIVAWAEATTLTCTRHGDGRNDWRA